MPELPEVETLRLALQRHVEGMTIVRTEVRDPVLRRPIPAELHDLLAGCRVKNLSRRAKYLVFSLTKKRQMLIHLGMTGFLHVVSTSAEPLKFERVAFHLDSEASLRYTDPRKFGLIEVFQEGRGRAVPEVLQGLGPEPLGGDFTAAALGESLRGSSRPVKNLLLDQAIIAGIGNIYASEALFLAGVHPGRAANSLSLHEGKALHAAIQRVLRQAIACGSTMVHRLPGVAEEQVHFDLELNVYERAGEPCRVCGKGMIQRLVQAGRSSYCCPLCQPLNRSSRSARRKEKAR